MGVRTRGATSGERQARSLRVTGPVRRGQVVVTLWRRRPATTATRFTTRPRLFTDLDLPTATGPLTRLFRMLVRIPAAVAITISVMSSRRPPR
jgi:hypothetical protein